MTRPAAVRILLGAAALTVILAGAGGAAGSDRALAASCRAPRAGPAYRAKVLRALRSGRDVWGERLLHARQGPTAAGAARFLAPLVLARAAHGPLTGSGVYAVPFSQPLGAQGAGAVALHAADGSAISSERADGPSLRVVVGDEPYGSCLARLGRPALAEGWLPILRTRYRDAAGRRFAQESFSARLDGGRGLTSFVRLTLQSGPRVRAWFSTGGRTLSAQLAAGETAWVAWPGHGPARLVDAAAYEGPRAALAAYWERRLGEAALIEVPEPRVQDAERALLVQNLALTWRYSIGNAYEEFSFPEGVNNAEVAAAYGLDPVARSILRTSLTRKPTPYPNWRMGEKLLGFALLYRLGRDRAFLDQATPTLRGYVNALGRQIERSPTGLLGREQYSSDVHQSVYGLHSQAVVWQGLRELGAAWADAGKPELAARCRTLAARLGGGLRAAVRSSSRRLPDGSLFVPVRLLDAELPYDALTASRGGSYWNLVMPYALASGLLAPGSAESRGVLRYLLTHGSRLLGMVRAAGFALYKTPAYPVSGTDQVYGLNMARFLADEGEADQLVLSLYGQLAAGMTPGTFVAGEAASVAPLRGALLRSMYLPPNSTSNAAFLETLRLLLVHERRAADGLPRGLELAYSTPRAWLEPGKRIKVERLPTSFGPLSYELNATADEIQGTVAAPSRQAPASLRLRLRLPAGGRLSAVEVEGRPWTRFNARTATIDLSGRTGTITFAARYAKH